MAIALDILLKKAIGVFFFYLGQSHRYSQHFLFEVFGFVLSLDIVWQGPRFT